MKRTARSETNSERAISAPEKKKQGFQNETQTKKNQARLEQMNCHIREAGSSGKKCTRGAQHLREGGKGHLCVTNPYLTKRQNSSDTTDACERKTRMGGGGKIREVSYRYKSTRNEKALRKWHVQRHKKYLRLEVSTNVNWWGESRRRGGEWK